MSIKNYICHINLAENGSCKYDSKCKWEHVNRPYSWKIMTCLSGAPDNKSSIANRILKADECEKIEKAYSDPNNRIIQLE